MDLDRFTTILDAYGAAPERWPAEERVDAEHLLNASPEARTLRDQAARIDLGLNRLAVPSATAALADAIARRALATPQDRAFSLAGWLTQLLGGPPLWPRLAGFAAALVVGLGIGVSDLGLTAIQGDSRDTGEIALFDNSFDDTLL